MGKFANGYSKYDSSNIFKRSWDGSNKGLGKLWNIPQVNSLLTGDGIMIGYERGVPERHSPLCVIHD